MTGFPNAPRQVPAPLEAHPGADIVHYDIEADWHLLNTCNYRCSYCFISAAQLAEKIPPVAEPAIWRDALASTGLTWLLHLTGGEPTVLPQFVSLCETLSGRHLLSLNTNLSRPSIKEFARRVDPARVRYINAGFHLAERIKRSGTRMFLEHAASLIERDFPIFASLVATPDVLYRYEEGIKALEPAGLFPIPKVLRGVYKGLRYPQSYTREELQLFRDYASAARSAHQPAVWRSKERPSIDLFGDEEFLMGEPDFKGKLCHAGERFVRLRANGDVFRCSETRPLGNLLAGTMRLDRPRVCDTQYCVYFCKKYAHP